MDAFGQLISSMHTHDLRCCIQSNVSRHTYAQVLDDLRRWQSRFDSLNIAPGSVIALRSDYSATAIAALLAALARPAVVALLPRDINTDSALRDTCAASFLDLAPDGNQQWHALPGAPKHPLIEQLAGARQGGIILFTSGSTGPPKAALHSVERFLRKFVKKRGRAFRTMAFLLFDHVAGLDTVFYTLMHGGALILTRRRDPDSILALIESQKVEVLPTSPSFLRMLCALTSARKYDLSSLKVITYASEPMDPDTLKRINAAFPRVQITQKYGTTETGSPRTVSRGNNSLWLKFDGEDMKTRVVDGVLWIRSERSILGYLNAPSPIIEHGWYCTGDLVEVDGEWIRFLGRANDIINVGGEKVTPTEVEQAILELSFVRDVAVFGQPHVLLGQVVAARVSLTMSASPDQKAATQRIRMHCRERLASYKVPIRINVVTHTLINDRQKVQRKTTSVEVTNDHVPEK